MELPPLRLIRTTAEEDENAEPVSPTGRICCHPKMYCTVISIIKFKDPIHDIPAFKQAALHTLGRHKPFSAIMRLDQEGHEVWVQTKIDIDKHVIVPIIPSKTDACDLVEEYASNLSLSFDTSRPLWDIHILNIRSVNSAGAFILRTHHSLGDGTSLMSMFLAFTRTVNDPDKPPSAVPIARKVPQRSYLQALWHFFLVLWYTLTSIVKIIATSLYLEDSSTPIKRSRGVELLPKKISSLSFPLEKMKIIKAATQATINDVFLGTVSAGITRYLLQNHRYLSADEKVKKHLEGLQITATSAVNVRPIIGLQELSQMLERGSQARWGNQVGYTLTPLELRDYEDPLEHVRKAKVIMARKKKSFEAYFTYSFAIFVLKLFGRNAIAKLLHTIAMHSTISLSNVIGPLERITFLGNEVTSITPTVIGLPQSLCLHMQTYSGEVRLVASSTTSIIPDPEALLQHCVDAIEDMIKASTELSLNL